MNNDPEAILVARLAHIEMSRDSDITALTSALEGVRALKARVLELESNGAGAPIADAPDGTPWFAGEELLSQLAGLSRWFVFVNMPANAEVTQSAIARIRELEAEREWKPIETQQSVAQWAHDTFGADPSWPSIAARANLEMAELVAEACRPSVNQEKIGKEVADVLIILHRMAVLIGRNIHQLVDEKMAINRARQWHRVGDGTGYHKHVETPAVPVAEGSRAAALPTPPLPPRRKSRWLIVCCVAIAAVKDHGRLNAATAAAAVPAAVKLSLWGPVACVVEPGSTTTMSLSILEPTSVQSRVCAS